MEEQNSSNVSIEPTAQLNVRVLTDTATILEQRERLRRFAAECNQPYALHWLPFHLYGWDGDRKANSLVLVERTDAGRTLVGAALLLEYHPLGPLLRIGMMEEVVAPETERDRIVASIAEAMICKGFTAVILSFVAGIYSSAPESFLCRDNLDWVKTTSERRETMRLDLTLGETLRRMSASARNNLRYYRNRFHAIHHPTFFPDARKEMSASEAIELVQTSKFPVSHGLAQQRYDCSVSDEGFLMGLRLPDGRWVGALGGWRTGTDTVMQWQANSLSFERDSLVNVLRAHLLEHEIERGTRTLTIAGGTAHHMNTAFERSERVVFTVRSRSHSAKLVSIGAGFVNQYRSLTRKPISTLAARLADPTLRWQKPGPPASNAVLQTK